MTAYYYKDSEVVGKYLVAETNEGVCAVLLGNSEEEMLQELKNIFPQDTLIEKSGPSPDTITKWIDDGERDGELRLDIRTGTPLQQEVWLQIMKIPRGDTLTYKELAERSGNPTAWRAVASACGRNILGGIIPCHRVVSKDPEKMSYRWGSEKKKALLLAEDKRNIIGRTVISEPGSSLQVTTIHLSRRAKKALNLGKAKLG